MRSRWYFFENQLLFRIIWRTDRDVLSKMIFYSSPGILFFCAGPWTKLIACRDEEIVMPVSNCRCPLNLRVCDKHFPLTKTRWKAIYKIEMLEESNLLLWSKGSMLLEVIFAKFALNKSYVVLHWIAEHTTLFLWSLSFKHHVVKWWTWNTHRVSYGGNRN